MIWKYSVLTIDRLVLVLILRYHEINEAQVCFFIIQLLLLKTQEFRNRVQEFVKENSPEHWKQSNWHEKHMSFHQKFPEKFVPDEASTNPVLPVFFGNCCYRFLPILDIVVSLISKHWNLKEIKNCLILDSSISGSRKFSRYQISGSSSGYSWSALQISWWVLKFLKIAVYLF